MTVLSIQCLIVNTIRRYPGPTVTWVAGLGLIATNLIRIYQQKKQATRTYQLGIRLEGLESRMERMATELDGMCSKMDLVIEKLGENTKQLSLLSHRVTALEEKVSLWNSTVV